MIHMAVNSVERSFDGEAQMPLLCIMSMRTAERGRRVPAQRFVKVVNIELTSPD